MKRHYPDWLFYVLGFTIVGIILSYTLAFGPPQKLAAYKITATNFDSLLKEQKHVASIVNNSYVEWQINEVNIFYLNDSARLNLYFIPLSKLSNAVIKENNGSFNLDEYWKGNCLFIWIAYSRINKEGCHTEKSLSKYAKQIENGQLIITSNL